MCHAVLCCPAQVFLHQSVMRLSGVEGNLLVQAYLDGPKPDLNPAPNGATKPGGKKRRRKSAAAAAAAAAEAEEREGEGAASEAVAPPAPEFDSVVVSFAVGEDFPDNSFALPLVLHWAGVGHEGGGWMKAPEGQFAAMTKGEHRTGGENRHTCDVLCGVVNVVHTYMPPPSPLLPRGPCMPMPVCACLRLLLVVFAHPPACAVLAAPHPVCKLRRTSPAPRIIPSSRPPCRLRHPDSPPALHHHPGERGPRVCGPLPLRHKPAPPPGHLRPVGGPGAGVCAQGQGRELDHQAAVGGRHLQLLR